VKSAQRLAGIILEEAKLQLMMYNTQVSVWFGCYLAV
jgi:hypothetical protein